MEQTTIHKRDKKTKDGKRIKRSGGKRKGAGNKPKGDDRKCQFFCHVKEGIAKEYGKGDWERGLDKIKRQTQAMIDKVFGTKKPTKSE